MKSVSEMVSIAERFSGLPKSRVTAIARRLQDTCLLPRGNGKNPPIADSQNLAVFIIGLLSDAPLRTLSEATNTAAGFVYFDDEGKPHSTQHWLAAMIDSFKLKDAIGSMESMRFAFNSSLTVHGGSKPAIVLRVVCNDGPEEFVFTPQGFRWKPHESDAISTNMTMPGLSLFRIISAFKGFKY